MAYEINLSAAYFEANSDDMSIIEKQSTHIRDLYKQQLSIALIGMEQTWNMYSEWEKNTSGSDVQVWVSSSFQYAVLYADRYVLQLLFC